MLYLLDFQVEYGPDMTQKDLFSVWSKEAEAALNAKKAGVVVDLWKCVGERRIIAIVNVESPDIVHKNIDKYDIFLFCRCYPDWMNYNTLYPILDQILFTLPIMKVMGQYVNVKVTSLRRYEDFAADVNQWLSEAD